MLVSVSSFSQWLFEKLVSDKGQLDDCCCCLRFLFMIFFLYMGAQRPHPALLSKSCLIYP